MLGVCYYPEHWPKEDWPNDAKRMVDLGITYVRIAEFCWSYIEPQRDTFCWDWLDDALNTLTGAGLQVVMCTPTAAPPKWLIDQRPDILAWDAQGRPRLFGSRRHSCFSSPAWREETTRIVDLVAERYGTHPGVVGWQLDNEYGCHDTVVSYAPHCEPAFQAWLADRYGTIEALNEAWGTVFWSQTYTAFTQVPMPCLMVTEANPAHRFDYQRFSSDQVITYHALQAEIVRQHSPGRFISHNVMGFFDQFDHFALARNLDVCGWDSYPLGLTAERMEIDDADKIRFARTGHPDAAALFHDLYRGAGASRLWVMEQQPGPVNWARYNPSPTPGMVRLWTWEALAHGAETVCYFRWRQAPRAQEQMHAGLNRPDGASAPASAEAAQVARELATLADWGSTVPAPVALLFDYEAAWVLSIQPHGVAPSYLGLVQQWYTAVRRLGVDVDIIHPSALLGVEANPNRAQSPSTGSSATGNGTVGSGDYALVIAPTLPVISDATLAALASCRGTVVLGARTGSKSDSFAIPAQLPPGRLQTLVPVQVVEVDSVPAAMDGTVTWQTRTYPAGCWRERIDSVLTPHGHFSDGNGAIFVRDRWHYLAFWPDENFLLDYLAVLLAEHKVPTMRLDESVRLRRRGSYVFAFNRGAATVTAPAPAGTHFAIGDRDIGPGDLAAWTVTDDDSRAR